MARQPSKYDRFKVLREISALIAQHKKSPSRQQIADVFGAPRSSIQIPIRYLNANGYLNISDDDERKITLTELGERSVKAERLLKPNE